MSATRLEPLKSPPGLGVAAWAENWTIGAGTLHLEIMHLATGSVWLAQQEVSPERAAVLAMPEGFVASGIGCAVADLAFFARVRAGYAERRQAEPDRIMRIDASLPPDDVAAEVIAAVESLLRE